MINNSAALPPFEGPITRNPDNGTFFTVTIPFLGFTGSAAATNPTLTGATAARQHSRTQFS